MQKETYCFILTNISRRKLIEASISAGAQKSGSIRLKAETVRLIFKPYLIGDRSSGVLSNVDQEFSNHDEIVCPGTHEDEVDAVDILPDHSP
jgi:hypothetical protein